MRAGSKWIVISLLASTHFAWAHSGEHDLHGPWWAAWNGSPMVLVNLFLLTAFYWRGVSGLNRRGSSRFTIESWRIHAFFLSLFILVLALLSPIDVLSDFLASVHMVQHTLLMMVAAPLMVVGVPNFIAQWSVPAPLWQLVRRLRYRFRRLLSAMEWFARPLSIWLFYSLTLWIWHLPVLYEAAVLNPIVHDIQHLAFFISSFLFWKVILGPYTRTGLHPAVGIVYLFVTSLHAMLLGILMALSPAVWYPVYNDRTLSFGLTPLEDQQIAGYIMWMPAGLTYVIVACLLMLQLIRKEA